ncbi:MAG: histidine decarboxylase, pyruvoyl type [Patescibacteria group bacterium]
MPVLSQTRTLPLILSREISSAHLTEGGRCSGASDPERYFTALNVAASKVKKLFSDAGAPGLDAINAFDAAEVSRAHMGQLNLIEVSSFCGPKGFLWGEHVAAVGDSAPMFIVRQWDGKVVPVHDGTPLVDAAVELFGDRDVSRFRIAPGSLCPSAYKSVTLDRPGIAYAACGIGVPAHGGAEPVVFMENAATLETPAGTGREHREAASHRALAESVMAIAENQGLHVEKIHVVYDEVEVGIGEVGCALAIIPYFSLAMNALPAGDPSELFSMSIESWCRDLRLPRLCPSSINPSTSAPRS